MRNKSASLRAFCPLPSALCLFSEEPLVDSFQQDIFKLVALTMQY